MKQLTMREKFPVTVDFRRVTRHKLRNARAGVTKRDVRRVHKRVRQTWKAALRQGHDWPKQIEYLATGRDA